MKLACLFSGGKDSNYAMYLASKENDISCLISMRPINEESYMFQAQGNDYVKAQAQALDLPLIQFKTKGEKEKELEDLKLAIKKAKDEFKIEGVITGAIQSVYQATRIQKICNELELWCFNPLWQVNEEKFLRNLVRDKFEVQIIRIAAYPLNKKYLGKTINESLIENLLELKKKYQISPIFEGGEAETFVTNSPMFKYPLKIKKSEIKMDGENSGDMVILEVDKK